VSEAPEGTAPAPTAPNVSVSAAPAKLTLAAPVAVGELAVPVRETPAGCAPGLPIRVPGADVSAALPILAVVPLPVAVGECAALVRETLERTAPAPTAPCASVRGRPVRLALPYPVAVGEFAVLVREALEGTAPGLPISVPGADVKPTPVRLALPFTAPPDAS
jgi:hypothetical protein